MTGAPAFSPPDFDLLAAEYVLGTLEGADLDRAVALEASDDNFRRNVVFWQTRLFPLIDAVPPDAVPPELWQKIEQRLVQRVEVKAKAGTPSFWQRLFAPRSEAVVLSRRSALAMSLAALAGGFGLARWVGQPEVPSQIAVLTTDAGAPSAIVSVYASGIVELIPLQTIAVPDGRIIEVWTLQSRTQGPVSIGRMDKARRLRLDLKQLLKPETGHLFELTLEPPGGSPTGKPTGPILMKGLVQTGV
jgi:anti-sigma-K factor RskA